MTRLHASAVHLRLHRVLPNVASDGWSDECGDGSRTLLAGAPAIKRNIGVFLKLFDENMYDSLCHDHRHYLRGWHAGVCRACLNWQPGKGVSEGVERREERRIVVLM